jgi:hypothetical protein
MQSVLDIILSVMGTIALIIYAVPYCSLLAVLLLPTYYYFLKIFRG